MCVCVCVGGGAVSVVSLRINRTQQLPHPTRLIYICIFLPLPLSPSPLAPWHRSLQGPGKHLQQALTSGIVYQIYCSRVFGIRRERYTTEGSTDENEAAPIVELLDALLPDVELDLHGADTRRHGALLASSSPFRGELHSTFLSELIAAGTTAGLDLLQVCRNVGRYVHLF